MRHNRQQPRARLVLERLITALVTLALLAAAAKLTPTAAAPPSATTLTLTPVADAYVDAAHSDTNYGAIAILRTHVSPEQRSYLRFNVTGTAGQTITQAKLRLYANGSSSVGYRVQAVSSNSWAESSITYNNQPALGEVVATVGAHTYATYTEADVTSYVRGDGAYSLAITTTSTKIVSYPSREATSNRPQLVLVLGEPPTTPTWTPTRTATPTATASPTPSPHPADTNGDGYVDDGELLAFFQQQLGGTVSEVFDSSTYPRANIDGRWDTVSASHWTSGFFPGALWLMFGQTGDPIWRDWAGPWTGGLEGQETRTDTHDIGFMIYNSFVRAYELRGWSNDHSIALQAASSLATRYDPDVKAIRSWDFGSWSYPVIIDNMMNLELLFWAARNGGSQNLYDIAVNHALTTLRDHVRADGSTYHLVDYNPTTGAVIAKTTHQGYDAESTWARGQAWAIYGFTMAYRYTGRAEFLATAQRLADYWISHVPQDDYVPFWDFEAPDIPNTDKDSSAAAIAASAFAELGSVAALSATDRQRYQMAAQNTLAGLRSPRYLEVPAHSHAILLHGVGVHPDARQGAAAPGSDVDVPLIYGDMFFIEAFLRSLGTVPPATATPTATSTPTTTAAAPTATVTSTPTQTASAATATATPPLPGTAVDLCGVPNAAWTDTGRLLRGGAPPQSAFACLAQFGVDTIVDQRLSGEDTINEPELARQAGIEYISLGLLNDTAPSPDLLRQWNDTVHARLAAGKLVLVHDSAGRGRMGFWDAVYWMQHGLVAERAVEDRYLAKTLPFLGAKIGCADGGNGQVQALAEIGQLLTGVTYYPRVDEYGTTWPNCARPSYMSGWDYQTTFAANTPTPTATATSVQPTATDLPPTATRTATAPPTAAPLTLSFVPAADAYVDAAHSSTNYGSIAILRTYVSPEQRSYLRFTITGIGGRSVTRARLRLYANGSSTAGYSVRGVSDLNWSEMGITYNNMPTVGPVLSNSGPHSYAVWTEVDLTGYITSDGTYSVAITTTSTKIVSYPSREASANQPQLIVELAGPP